MPPVNVSDPGPSLDTDLLAPFVTSFSLVLFSELFDKTFFIAAIMATRHGRLTVFLGAALALFVMTVLSAMLGNLSMAFLPPRFCALASGVLMYLFGFKTLYEAHSMAPSHTKDEIEGVEAEIQKRKVRNLIYRRDNQFCRGVAVFSERLFAVFRINSWNSVRRHFFKL